MWNWRGRVLAHPGKDFMSTNISFSSIRKQLHVDENCHILTKEGWAYSLEILFLHFPRCTKYPIGDYSDDHCNYLWCVLYVVASSLQHQWRYIYLPSTRGASVVRCLALSLTLCWCRSSAAAHQILCTFTCMLGWGLGVHALMHSSVCRLVGSAWHKRAPMLELPSCKLMYCFNASFMTNLDTCTVWRLLLSSNSRLRSVLT